jgi:AGZA family xanthine/uracil permease-like MFS transporter
VAILPILLYIGMLIGSQAFQETPRRHAPAIILSLTPHLAAWATGMVTGTLTAAGVTEITPEVYDRLAREGVLLQGLHVMGGGAVLTGIVLGAMTVFIIERHLWRATAFALAGATLTFFGFMHGEHIGVAQSPTIAASYVLLALLLAGCARFAGTLPRPPESEAESAHS